MRMDNDKLREQLGGFVEDYRAEMRNEARVFLNRWKGLQRNANSTRALRVIIEGIVTKGWRLQNLGKKFKRITGGQTGWTLDYFRSDAVRGPLEEVKAEARVDEFLRQTEDTSLREWLAERYAYAVRGEEDPHLKGIKGLGPKGRDDMLRSLGYLKRIPIDMHEKRFMIRTGIFHTFADKNGDPDDYDDYHHAMTEFCRVALKGRSLRVEGVTLRLSESPGLFDKAVFAHCAKRRVCGLAPKCFDDKGACKLYGICWWSQKR
ncbi:MAG: hypothetical protein LN417_06140 [Candidatus Thermoplasmatota archaeon]|nr:hypothetical protein [Candidatus Thermoplasmatota archaeon]